MLCSVMEGNNPSQDSGLDKPHTHTDEAHNRSNQSTAAALMTRELPSVSISQEVAMVPNPTWLDNADNDDNSATISNTESTDNNNADDDSRGFGIDEDPHIASAPNWPLQSPVTAPLHHGNMGGGQHGEKEDTLASKITRRINKMTALIGIRESKSQPAPKFTGFRVASSSAQAPAHALNGNRNLDLDLSSKAGSAGNDSSELSNSSVPPPPPVERTSLYET